MSPAGSGISAGTTRAPSCSSRSTCCSAALLDGYARPPTEGGRVSSPTVRPSSLGAGTGACASTDQERHLRDGAGERPDGVEGRDEREHAVERDAPPARLQADEPAARAGSRTEQPVSVPRPMSQSPAAIAAALPPEEPPAVRPGCRVLHGAVPGVLARDAPRELVQVRLADERRARVEQALHRRRRALRDVIGVDRRAVGGADPCRVDQVLHREPAAGERAFARGARLERRDRARSSGSLTSPCGWR